MIQLENHCEIFGKIVIVSQFGGNCINIETYIRKYELSNLPLILFHQKGQLKNGRVRKSQLLHEMPNSHKSLVTCKYNEKIDIIVCDATCVVYSIEKTPNITTFSGFAVQFLER